jgi:hypothetical protein
MDRIQITALILILAGTAIPLMCIIKMYMINSFKKNAVITKAIINQTEKRRGMKGAVYYMLAIQYKDHAGNIFTGLAIGAKKHIPGSTIPIMYKTSNPAKYKTDFGKYLPWLLGFSLLFLGLLIWFAYWLLNIEYTVRPE